MKRLLALLVGVFLVWGQVAVSSRAVEPVRTARGRCGCNHTGSVAPSTCCCVEKPARTSHTAPREATEAPSERLDLLPAVSAPLVALVCPVVPSRLPPSNSEESQPGMVPLYQRHCSFLL